MIDWLLGIDWIAIILYVWVGVLVILAVYMSTQDWR